jgi:hypothetical protein
VNTRTGSRRATRKICTLHSRSRGDERRIAFPAFPNAILLQNFNPLAQVDRFVWISLHLSCLVWVLLVILILFSLWAVLSVAIPLQRYNRAGRLEERYLFN